MPWRAELPQLARLSDLPKHVLKEIPLCVGVGLVKPQAVHQIHHLREDGGLVNRQPRALHEVVCCALAEFGEEREDFVPYEANQRLAR